jgi:histidine triad (HIT) family protein
MSEPCIFCKIVAGEIPTTKIYEDQEMIAFRDIKPIAPVHILIVPKKHVRSLADAAADDFALVGRMHAVAAELARKEGISDAGYRTVLNTTPAGGQVIFHLHLHLLGGKTLRDPV